ncbi:MAG: hypothetical protein NTU88_09945 [Armatimonadetes bacterium]|nr:hypothetical protein [Armatimonadota bacterium]
MPRTGVNIRASNPLGWIGLRETGLLLLSVVPGFGHRYVLGDARIGRLLSLSAVAALGAAVLAYRTPLADMLVAGVIMLSMYSVYVAVDKLMPMGREDARQMNRIAVGLLILATYLGTYWLLVVALHPLAMMVDIQAQPAGRTMAVGDRLLLWRHTTYRRGDIVAGTGGTGTPNAGPILGMPGDRIEVRDRVYVKGVPTDIVIPYAPPHDQEAPAVSGVEVTLGKDEYWIMPVVQVAGNLQLVAEAGVVRRADIWGKVVLITNPPARRSIVSRVSEGG